MSSSTTTQVPSGTYGLDPVHSTFGFTVRHNGVSKFSGRFESVDAKLEDGVLTGTAQVDSIKTAVPDLFRHLQAPDFFNAAETPTITFRSTDIRVHEDGSAEVEGELTIRGVSKSVTAKGTIGAGVNLIGGEVVGFDLETSIDRRDFGLNWQAPLPNGKDALAWDVVIEAHLELGKA